MKIGSTVLYQNRVHIILWVYSNGYCEIREKVSTYKIELVRSIDLIEIKEGPLDGEPYPKIILNEKSNSTTI
jgi:hypothetical protein